MVSRGTRSGRYSFGVKPLPDASRPYRQGTLQQSKPNEGDRLIRSSWHMFKPFLPFSLSPSLFVGRRTSDLAGAFVFIYPQKLQSLLFSGKKFSGEGMCLGLNACTMDGRVSVCASFIGARQWQKPVESSDHRLSLYLSRHGYEFAELFLLTRSGCCAFQDQALRNRSESRVPQDP